jgi:hypothetical protein
VTGIGRVKMRYAEHLPLTTFDEAYGVFLDSSHPGRESSPLLTIPPEGTCTAYTGSYQTGMNFGSFPDMLLGWLEGRGMNAGRALSLADGNNSRAIKPSGRGAYWSRLGIEDPGPRSNRPLFLKGQFFLFAGPGGRDVGDFEHRISTVHEFEWRNEQQVAAIERSRGVSVEWRHVSDASLVMTFAVSTDPLTTASAMSYCAEKPEVGHLRIPEDVFSYFPKTEDLPIVGPPSSLFFIVAARLENASTPAVRGLDEFWTIATFTRGRSVVYR